MVFLSSNPYEKIRQIEKACNEAKQLSVPNLPARDIEVVLPEHLPAKKGLSYKEGQARLLHDLANIELQAMELGLRTLIEFPEAPGGFREELISVTISESQHLRLCLEGLEKLGFKWGDWPIHVQLWNAVSKEDSFLDRILIVHRYLEGSGLDAGETFMRKLSSVLEGPLHHIAKTIVTEEIGHVEFGSRWYRQVCALEKIDPVQDFPQRMTKLRYRIPKRIEKISWDLRRRAGFLDSEIQFMENFRSSMSKY